MTNEQLLNEIKTHIDARYFKLQKELSDIRELVELRCGDPVTIAELQHQLNEEKAKARDREIEQYIEQHPSIINK